MRIATTALSTLVVLRIMSGASTNALSRKKKPKTDVCGGVPDVIGALAVWRQNNQKQVANSHPNSVLQADTY